MAATDPPAASGGASGDGRSGVTYAFSVPALSIHSYTNLKVRGAQWLMACQAWIGPQWLVTLSDLAHQVSLHASRALAVVAPPAAGGR
jgi:hypothetical protein